ncbi:hypothetical protein BJY52DRAFT_361263 [Lactarius psammicola]|nr:hypothetical protein BJY52DRAFT_361263 [Lactarius psammicola]
MQFLRTSASEGGRIITARTLQPPLGISKLPVATTMSSPSQTPVSSSQFKPIFDAALGEYKKKTGNDLLDHQIAKELQTCDSVEAVLDIIQHLAEAFYNFREGDKRLMKYIGASVHVLYNISAILGEGVDIGLSSAKAVVVGFGVLLAAAKGVWASHDALVNLFERIQLFLNRLGVYTQIPPTEDMVEILVKVMAEILYILSIATKEMQRSRARIYLKNLLRRTDIEDALNRLDRLTHEEVRMAMARVLEIMNGLRDDTKKSNGAVHQIANDMGEMKDDLGEIKWIQIEQDVQNWFSPPDPSVNYNIACEAYHEGTAVWFFKGSKFKEWELIGSLLWIHGKPGSGKTIICTAIIKYVMSLRDAGLAALAYFYFDFRNEEKQNLRNLLTSLLIQLSAYSEPCRNMIFRLYSMHRKGARQPGIGVLIDCLKEMLKVIAHQPAYIIVDALDECPNMSGVPTPRETVLSLVGDLVRMQLPSLHVCVTSRPEIDIKTVLGSLAYSSVSLHNESGQQKDISDYVHTVVHTDRKMRKWRAEEKKLVVEELSNKADGMFRWVFFQLEALRNCPPSSLRQTLDQLPNSETLDEKYTH